LNATEEKFLQIDTEKTLPDGQHTHTKAPEVATVGIKKS
jgi:hypothetical protein